MITGFNTDIEYEGVIYHVQTEDKGVSTPLILSLVYNRGTILASKRSPYDDLLVPAFDEKALSERLQKQHKLMCAAVRAGRLEDLKRMTRDSAAAAKQKKTVAPAEGKPPAEAKENTQPTSADVRQTPEVELKNRKNSAPVPPFSVKQPPPPPKIQKEKLPVENPPKEAARILPKAAPSPVMSPVTSSVTMMPTHNVATTTAEFKKDSPFDSPPRPLLLDDELVIDAVEIIEEELILPAEAVEIVSDFTEGADSFGGKLKIDLPGDVIFRSGERKTVRVVVYRNDAQNGLAGAHIMIKVFGAAFRPLIFHAKTDERGAATVHLQMPQFKGGRAAVLIRAMCGGEETELRRVVEQK